MSLSRNKKEIILAILMLVFITFLYGFFLITWKKDREIEKKKDINIAVAKNFFTNLNLEGKAVVVWDAKENKMIYGWNEEAQLPLASLTKLMTALVVSDLVPEETILTVKNSDLKKEGDSGFKIGQKWTIKNMSDFTLMTSSNDGAHALASVVGAVSLKSDSNSEKNVEKLFIDAMNKKAQELGLKQTFYLNESGLDYGDSVSGAYGSAKDMAILMSDIVQNKPFLLEATKYSHLKIYSKDLAYEAENTNLDVNKIPGIIGSKTGYTDLAGGNLVVGFDIGIGHPIIISVLGSTREGRFLDVEKLVDATIKQLAQNI